MLTPIELLPQFPQGEERLEALLEWLGDGLKPGGTLWAKLETSLGLKDLAETLSFAAKPRQVLLLWDEDLWDLRAYLLLGPGRVMELAIGFREKDPN